MTSKGSSEPAQQLAANALAAFLAAPPPGTPPEVIEALGLVGGESGEPLPPRLFFAAVEQSPVAISITNAEAIILYANAAFEALTGYTRAEVIGKNESLLSNNATPATIYRQLWRTIKDKRTWTGTLVNRTKAGGDYLAELTISPVLDQQGEIRYFLGMHRDVTRVHELEGALRQQKARVETVLQAAPVLVVLLDGEGRVLLENREYEKLQGELQGSAPIEVLRAALRKQAGFDPLEAALADRGFKDVEVSVEVPGAGGPRWFACSGTPAHELDASARTFFGRNSAGERRLLLLANDITARRREIERAHLENLRARLAEQQLGHTMREALAAAIYQIQGPLNVIHAASEMIKGGSANLTVLSGTLEQISAAGQKALETLEAALPVQAREAGILVNVNALLRQVLELETDRLLAAGIVVDWQPAHVLPEFNGHKNQLRAMFKHLIDNAIQALNESGKGHRELRVATRAVESAVEVVIQDNGPGIPPEQRYAVFEPFSSGWRHRRGRAGMGLALAQEIVNQHGGSIEIDPEYLDGCRVRLLLTAAVDE
ncbi:nitrogen fixation negative regulator NifL [Thiococcus pfennigii]|jgi:nitrogen fixation negative regulator NifL|uniref:nitrogen fixation negative regulator NifL n=1 Tax=Thiococcus pfennigii TaxID=1057 RepID=UPI001907FAC8|nr:nitrogen fixation negative regulator NifL [Thiococcus pfennigii]MBK1699363.1 nitrogen fixation negative regulator NifL [Thiococcus pfennigii]MBK1730938.1 nitrogen fixation negative regulator NifL [Thiococcus pfennigii]